MFGIGDYVVVGYDLSNEYAQISYSENGSEMGKTISLVEGTEQYNIPVCLFKRSEVNQWFVAADAISYSAVEEGEMVEHLWDRALLGEPVTVVGEEFDPLALLALYIRRTLGLLNKEVKKERIKGIMFTVPTLSKRALEVLETIGNYIDCKDVELAFQGREESVYHYVVNQPKELWQYDVCVYDMPDKELYGRRFHLNKMTKPMVAFVDTATYDMNLTSDSEMDERFTEIVKETMDGHIVSCAYLLGDGFNGDWCRESIKELCKNRRAFKGNNLYSRGACYAMRERMRLRMQEQTRTMIYLGADKLRANIGMDISRRGEDSYLALLDGGENWFDSKKTVDLIIDTGNSLMIKITPLDGRNVRNVEIVLDGLSEHETKAVRVRLEVMMESENLLRVNVTDMGFGEFRAATNQTFTKQISLEQEQQ